MEDARPVSRGSLAWTISSESALMLGGGRALILQVAEPRVAAGVEQHSNYRVAPWRRLQRTIAVTQRIVFGDGESSAGAADGLKRVHARVHGRDPTGRAYRALDPELLMWVHATLLDTSLLIYDRYVRRLSEVDRATYYREMKPVGEAYGIPLRRQPADLASFRDYWEGMLAERLKVTKTTRDVAASLFQPALPAPARLAAVPAVEAIRLVTVGTLPDLLREQLGLPWGRARAALLSAQQESIRRLMPLAPSIVRQFPAARRTAA